ncbi:hypothetical protein BDK51DRAFT_26162 [Blyttiomyces helicus]|uniref:Pentacotripeptide-repeat region of PRORP domain-containing protein n=1 Tax=Blyttiomyces helicus TaxID=388810 RepID=A0A4P9W9U8_9FUNG|nr:hypothetical protein BDK51DRAFT_26162 [Blyttiomyces helicus]|eukprot:RKO89339.1 hypothetical protein BDK51DRAFT_26162 [Blyttiomyces helicus]
MFCSKAFKAVARPAGRVVRPLAVSTTALLSRQNTSAPLPPAAISVTAAAAAATIPAAPRTRHDPDPQSQYPGHNEPVPSWKVEDFMRLELDVRQRLDPASEAANRLQLFREAANANKCRRLYKLFWDMERLSPMLLSFLTLGELNAVLFAISAPQTLEKGTDEALVLALDAVLKVAEKTRMGVAALEIRAEEEHEVKGEMDGTRKWAKEGSSGFGDADTRRAMVRVFAKGPCEPERLRKVVEELGAMCGGEQGIDRETRIAIMGAFARGGDMAEAARRFRDLNAERAEIEVGNALLDALCRGNAEAAIIATFEGIKASGPPPDAETYRPVALFYMRRKRHDRVVELWNECLARGIDRAKVTRVMGMNAALAMVELGQTDQLDRIVDALAQEKDPGSFNTGLWALQAIAAEKRGDVEKVWKLLPEYRGNRPPPPATMRALARVVGPISAPSAFTSKSANKGGAISAESLLTPTSSSATSSIDPPRVKNFENLMVRLGHSLKAPQYRIVTHLINGYIALGDIESALALTRAQIPEFVSKSYRDIARHILSQPPLPAPSPASTAGTPTSPSQLPAILSLLDEMARADVPFGLAYADSIWTLTERGDVPAVMTLLSRLEGLDGRERSAMRDSLHELIELHRAHFDEIVEVDAASPEGNVVRCRRALFDAANKLKMPVRNAPSWATSSSREGVDRETRVASMQACARAGDSEEAARWFRKLIGKRPSTGTGNALLDALCWTNAETAIVAAFEIMKTSGPRPNVKTYLLVVEFYARRKQHDRVVELWNECLALGIDRAEATRAMGMNAALAMAELGASDQLDRTLVALTRANELGALKTDLRGLRIVAAEKRGNVEEVWRRLPELLTGKLESLPIAWQALARVVGPISAPTVAASKLKDSSAASPHFRGEPRSSTYSSRVRNFEKLMVRLDRSSIVKKPLVGQLLVTAYLALGDTESALAIVLATKIPAATASETYSEIARHILSQPPETEPSPASTTALASTTTESTSASQLPAILSLLDVMAGASVSPKNVYVESIWTLTERGDLPALTTLLPRLETLPRRTIDHVRNSLAKLIALHQTEYDKVAKVNPASIDGDIKRCRRALVEASPDLAHCGLLTASTLAALAHARMQRVCTVSLKGCPRVVAPGAPGVEADIAPASGPPLLISTTMATVTRARCHIPAKPSTSPAARLRLRPRAPRLRTVYSKRFVQVVTPGEGVGVDIAFAYHHPALGGKSQKGANQVHQISSR